MSLKLFAFLCLTLLVSFDFTSGFCVTKLGKKYCLLDTYLDGLKEDAKEFINTKLVPANNENGGIPFAIQPVETSATGIPWKIQEEQEPRNSFSNEDSSTLEPLPLLTGPPTATIQGSLADITSLEPKDVIAIQGILNIIGQNAQELTNIAEIIHNADDETKEKIEAFLDNLLSSIRN